MATFLLSPLADHTFSSELSSDVPLTIYGFICLSFEDFTTWSLGPLWSRPTQVLPSPRPLLMSPLSLSFLSGPRHDRQWQLHLHLCGFFLVKNPSLCFLKQTESFQTKIKSLVLNAHCSSSCKTLKDHCACLPLLEYGCNQLPASSIFSALSLSFCFWLKTLCSASQPCPAAS